MSKKLRVGVVGCGGIAQMMHLPHLAERPDLFEIRALADVKREVVDAVGQRYGVTERHTDPLAVINHPEVDAVLLLSSGSHRELAAASLAARKALFVEKPLGYGVRETEELGRLAKESGAKLMVGYHKRYDPAYLRARELVKELGGLRLVEVTVLHPDDGAYRTHHPVLPAQPYRPQPEPVELAGLQQAATEGPLAPNLAELAGTDAPVSHRAAAKLLCESLIHDINVVRGVLGEPEAVVSATTWRGGFAQSSVTRFADDVHATLTWIFVPGLRNYEERVRFVGSDWRVTLTFPSPYLRNFPTPLVVERMDGADHVAQHRTVSYEEAFRAELLAFHRYVQDGVAPETDVADALGDMKWIQAIARAFRSAS
jgi:predicted dehydrogenase